MTAPSPAVRLDKVVKRYGDREVIKEIDLGILPGECIALVGHNGAGKTTLVKLLLGMIAPESGNVQVFGRSPIGREAVRARANIGFLPESVAFSGTLSGREMLIFYARLKGQPVADCAPMLARVGLEEAAARRVKTYSKGMRQRLGLAQALLGAPALLLLDEPTSGLDPLSRRDFYDIIDERRAAGATVVLCSHSLTEIEGRTDRVAILSEGRLAACGTLDELREAAGLPITIRLSALDDALRHLHAGLGESLDLRRVNASKIEIDCLPRDKTDVIRRITELGVPLEDLDITMPSLEALYAHFQPKAVER